MDRKQAIVLALLFALVPASTNAYTRRALSADGPPLVRPDAANIVFLLNDETAAGMMNSEGEVLISAGSDPLAAIRASTQLWSNRPFSVVQFATVELTTLQANSADGMHVITFWDTPENRSLVGDATGVTLSQFNGQGIISDTDIYMNPDISGRGFAASWSTIGEPDSHDIITVAAHEVGHALSAGHTGVQGATMYQASRAGELFSQTLADDDLAFLYDAYPNAAADSTFGRIAGRVSLTGGSPVLGALVAAVDAATGATVGGLSHTGNGAYSLGGIPPGNYFVYAEPLNGPVFPGNVNLFDNEVTLPFQTTLFGGNASPQMVAVSAGNTATADITAEPGDPALDIQVSGIMTGDGGFNFGAGPLELQPGASHQVLLWGPGLENVTAEDVEVLGPAFTLNSVEVDPQVVVNDFPALTLNIDVVAAAQQKAVVAQGVAGSALGTVLIRQGALTTAATGIFAVEGLGGGPPAPVFSQAGVVNAASFLGGGVAPGEIISIFGTDIGPAEQGLPGFDPATGKLFTSFAGVTVTFDGTPAPLFFLIDNQLNLQAPFEIAGQANTNVVISVNGQASPAVAVPVANQAPGIFTFAGGMGQGIIQNQDGSINTPENPEVRGNAVVIFATGQGVVNPPLETGQAAGQPLSEAASFAATIGGLDARAFFAGMTPGFVGLLQVNAFVPEGVQAGNEVPVQIAIGGVPSQPNVTMAVAP
jgi:uncharacterized protein (TIGR03437 family)